MTRPRPRKKVFVMNLNLKGSGMGVCILDTINQIRYCLREDLIPVVQYDASSENHFFDPAYGNSMWEQYFEPVGEYSSADIDAWRHDPEHPLSPDDLVTPSRSEILRILEQHPDSVFAWPYAKWRRRPPADIPAWCAAQREKACDIVDRYIRPRPHLCEKVDRFWQARLENRFVLGVQIRGTDFHYAPPVSPAEYFEPIDAWLARQPALKLFVATDQVQYLKVMEERYADRIVSYDCLRSDNEVAPFQMKASPYQKGEDVLLDILLLARCNHLLKGASHVGAMATYFCRTLSYTDLSLGKTKAYGQDYGRFWSYDAAKPAWAVVGQSDLTQVASNAASQSLWQTLNYGTRAVAWALIRRVHRLFGG